MRTLPIAYIPEVAAESGESWVTSRVQIRRQNEEIGSSGARELRFFNIRGLIFF